MALKFQFNKTALQQLKKDLKIRERALPTLKAKETALRLEVKKAREELKNAELVFNTHADKMNGFAELWEEFPVDILRVGTVDISFRKVAGVRIPLLGEVVFTLSNEGIFQHAAWITAGVELLKESARLSIEIDIAKQKLTVLEYARKKTTQKVNLYEKVQIPEYHEGILKIKRFMEDQENLEKSAQKILKMKLSEQEAAA